ncbi:hypothetical protein [Streptomyces sp. MUM 2J]|uniref:hypothetical protein n=1 Tax=Streptomyces sp. MUM 2J TaxID=2791987 RepID=UPI001F045204|nr:hypothetical protein [Streptomyces sp. MUM 2J]MCH0562134.1 hypothetical protein [Streptomyces sp. MUM 2J]
MILYKEEIAKALPTPDAVPPGWETAGEPRLFNDTGESGRLAFGRTGYRAPDLDGAVGFSISSYSGTADAMAGFSEFKAQYGDATRPTSIVGADQAFARSGCITERACSATIVVRAGSVVLMVNINSDAGEAPDPKILNSVSRMQVARAQQVERGEAPTAKAS